MRVRSALVQAVVDRAVIPPAAAVMTVQTRCHFQRTFIAPAPRRRSSAKSTKAKAALKLPKPAPPPEVEDKAAIDMTPITETEFSLEEVPLPSVVADALSHEDGTRCIVTADKAQEAAETPSTSSHGIHDHDDAQTQAVPEETAASEPPVHSVAPSCAANVPELDLLEVQRAERHRLVSLQRRFLVGAHAALESTNDCPDPRALVPRLKIEEISTDKSYSESAVHTRSNSSGTLLHVHTHPPRSNPESSKNATTAVTAGKLSLTEAVQVFADVFAFTLHSVPPRFRALATTTAAPMLTMADSTEVNGDAKSSSVSSAVTSFITTPSAGLSALSFLSSPFTISAVQVLASRSPFQHSTAMESIAPLHWLETSFEELCRRIAQELHDELSHDKSVITRDKATGEENGNSEDPQRLAVVCEAVRERAASLISAVEEAAKSVGSRSLLAMRRQWKQEGGASAAATATSVTRRRKSHRPVSTTTAAMTTTDAEVCDTLLNTVERVGLELHLLHVWLSRLCEDVTSLRSAAGDGNSATNNNGGGAPCVEAVVRQALSWFNTEATAIAFSPSISQLQWMLATAMLERVHVQSYHLHLSHVSSATSLKELSSAGSTRPTYTVEEKHFRGLAALVDFALTERSTRKHTLTSHSVHHGGTPSPTTPLDEAVFVLLAAFYTVLPSYAALLPAWQRAVGGGRAHGRGFEDGNDTGTGEGMHLHSDRDSISAASPTAVWDVVAVHWALQEDTVRQEGGLAAVWWLRLLPLWLSTAGCTLQLRIVVTVLVSNDEDTTDRNTRKRDSETNRMQMGNDDVLDVHRFTIRGVTQSLDALLTKSADLLRDTLRFDGVRYERSLALTRPSIPQSLPSNGMALTGNEAALGGSAGNARVGDAQDGVKQNEENNGDIDEDNNNGTARADADAPPPLQRNRGKRSLFYRADGKESSIIQESEAESHGNSALSNLSNNNRSNRSRYLRFVSRTRGYNSLAGYFDGSATSSNSPHRASAHLSAASADAHKKTSALFDVLVLSAETPTLLTHAFGLTSRLRNTTIEESWAAFAHAKSELWQLLYALPSAAAVAAAASRSHDGTWSASQVLLRVLPSAVLSLLPSMDIVASAPTSPQLPNSATPTQTKKKGKKTPVQGTADDHAAKRAERTLRRALSVVENAQKLLDLTIFESIDHLLVALAKLLLRIERTGREQSTPTRRRALGDTKIFLRAVDQDVQRAQQQLASFITIGATTMMADNPLSRESVKAVWQLRHRVPRNAIETTKSATAAVVFSSAAAHAFAVQWTNALMKEIPYTLIRSRQRPSAVFTNARETMKMLQTPSTAAFLPLYAKQVSAAALLQSLTALSRSWCCNHDSMVHDVTAIHPKSFNITREDVMEVYHNLLDVLAADTDLRLLCCYATFVEGLYEVHLNLKADHAALIAWADKYLLPLVLPVVVAGLSRSQSMHNTAAHADLCETTLVLLSPLSRYAVNPQVAMSDVLRSEWNQVLLQVSLYCIRTAGRGGEKRATDYGTPPAVLPSLSNDIHRASSPLSTSAWWSTTFAHGAEPILLCLLDHSNTLLRGAHNIEPRDVDAAEGVRASLAAYVNAWDSQVRFGRCNWDAMFAADDVAAFTEENSDDNGSPAVPTTHTLLARLQKSCAAVQAFNEVTLPARTAGAAAAPFLASKSAKARQLGYLVRFMEHYLREQERISRLSDEEMHALMAAAASKGSPSSTTDSSSSPALPAVAVAPLSDTAPLVLLDFVGHLSSAGGWAMVTWSCNIAETVVKIELKRHRLIPEAARAVAATAILSQLRAVPPPGGLLQLPGNLLKSLYSLSDVVDAASESLLGFYRRSPIHGLLCHPTRDQYRVLAFGLKQATSYVKAESRRYRAWQDVTLQETAEEVEPAGERGVARKDGVDASQMYRKVGRYYARIWNDHLSAQKGAAGKGEHVQETRPLLDRRDHNRDFRYYVSCLVCLVDACMESAQLYLLRQQGDGEEDIRVVIEAAVMELCRSLAANIQCLLSLTREQRRTCFYREEAELLWASLCVVATISTVAPRDQKDRFFTPQCVQAIQRVLHAARQLVGDVMGEAASTTQKEESEETEQTKGDVATSTSAAKTVPLLNARPLCTALVHGAQLLLRDPRSSHRLAIRLAMRQRDRDDLTAVLTAFQVLLTCARLYEPGRSLLSFVWERLALELTQPLPISAETTFLVAATVPSRSEYGAVLRDLTAAHAKMSDAAASVFSKVEAEGTSKRTRKAGAHHDVVQTPTCPVPMCDVPTAMACVVENAAAVQQERQRSLQEATTSVYSRENGQGGSGVEYSYGLWGEGSAASSAGFLTQPHLNIAAALESGTVPLGEILDTAIAHAVTTTRAAGGRSSFDVVGGAAETGEGDDTPDGAIGFLRLIREYCQDMTDLLLHVPLYNILRHPQAELLFSCLNLMQGSVKPETENELWCLLSTKWKAELLEPCEATFMTLQQSQLELVRACRGVTDGGNWKQPATPEYSHTVRLAALRDSKSSLSSLSAMPLDMFARIESTTIFDATSPTGKGRAAATISSAAQRSMRDHWHLTAHNLSLHDDARRLVEHGGNNKNRSREVFPGELDREATGIAALSAMPDPVPIPVLLAVLHSLNRRGVGFSQASVKPLRGRASSQRNAQTAWRASSDDGSGSNGVAFTEFVEVLLTYIARAFWLLRPRLDDSAWLTWATVERSMAAYPTENGVRKQEWERVCRKWRLPINLEHAMGVAGQLFSVTERSRISAWLTAMREVCPALVSSPPLADEEKEEVAVYCYLRSMALYLQLLTLSMCLLTRHRMLGDLPDASPDAVRQRLQMQRQLRSNNNLHGQYEDTARALIRDVLREELKRLAQERQAQQDGVNRNLFEGAALQYLNVAWCVTRHTDSLTHMATDAAVSTMTCASGSNNAAVAHRNASAFISYADDVRLMVAGVLQDTLDALLYANESFHVPLTEQVARTLFTSGFSCDPLLLRPPHSDKTSQATGNAALPAVNVVAALLKASANGSTTANGSGVGAAAASTAMPSMATVLNPVARAELFVGSPTMLAVLTPHFIKRTAVIALQGSLAAAELLPVTSALEFYLSRRNVLLSPLLEATTELLTSCTVRSSAVHTYCERLASELTRREEFRQALEPPTIASVEQGAAGSISNEVVISFVAAIARQDVHVTKKTLSHLLHAIMTMRPDVFGQPPTADRQGKLTLVQVGTTVEATIDTTNPLYAPKPHAQTATKAGTTSGAGGAKHDGDGPVNADGSEAKGTNADDGTDATAVMEAFSADKWADFTAVSHRKALAALTISLPTVMEVAMHMEAMRTVDYAERRRAMQMLKAADDARRERVAVHRSQAQVAAATAVQRRVDESGSDKGKAGTKESKAARAHVVQVGKLDASLHLEDPLDFGVVMLHLRYALRKVVHASLRRLLHRQGPRMLAEVATMLQMVDPGMKPETAYSGSKGTDHSLRPYDGILAGTTRVLLSRALLCAQAIGYDANGAPIKLPPPFSSNKSTADAEESLEQQSVLKLPVPALQASAVEAAISALGTVKGRHARVGHSTGKIGLLTKEEKTAVHQRVELEREAAVTVGMSTLGVPWRGQQRILRALRYTRWRQQIIRQRKEYNQRRCAQRTTSALSQPSRRPRASSHQYR